MICSLCPRNCRVDRTVKKGYCGENNKIRVARAMLHHWEEPCISGKNGSGAVFFSGCTLKCVFCQNYSISNNKTGLEISKDDLFKIFEDLLNQGAENINLVTPDHFVFQIAETISKFKQTHPKTVFVYNTGSYIKKETLVNLRGLIDVYLPDLKYVSPLLSKRYSNAIDYFDVAREAIDEMYSQCGKVTFDKNGMINRGVIVRHLLLPGKVSDSKKVLSYLYKTYGDEIYISIMNQYTPVIKNRNYPELLEKVTEKEYDELINFAVKIGIKNAYIQEGETAKESFIPEFNLEGLENFIKI